MELNFNWLDWLMVAGLVLGALWGYSRGLVGVAVGSLGYFIALMAAGRLAPYLVEWLDKMVGITRLVTKAIAQQIRLPAEMANLTLSAASAERVAAAVRSLPLPDAYKAALLAQLQVMAGGPDGGKTLAELILGQLAYGLVSFGAFLLILLVGGWLLSQIGYRFGDALDHLPLVGRLNRLLGMAVAVMVVGASFSVILGVGSPLTSLPSARGLSGGIAGSQLAPFLARQYEWMARWVFGQVSVFFFQE